MPRPTHCAGSPHQLHHHHRLTARRLGLDSNGSNHAIIPGCVIPSPVHDPSRSSTHLLTSTAPCAIQPRPRPHCLPVYYTLHMSTHLCSAAHTSLCRPAPRLHTQCHGIGPPSWPLTTPALHLLKPYAPKSSPSLRCPWPAETPTHSVTTRGTRPNHYQLSRHHAPTQFVCHGPSLSIKVGFAISQLL